MNRRSLLTLAGTAVATTACGSIPREAVDATAQADRLRAAGVRVVVSGHSHRPLVEERDGVLYVNPGSAGPRRFRLPISLGELIVDGDAVSARITELEGA